MSSIPSVRKLARPSPINQIRGRLTDLRGSKEKLLSEIEQLQNEKAEIEDALPSLLDTLMAVHTSVTDMQEERNTYDAAIADMVTTSAMILEGGAELLDGGPVKLLEGLGGKEEEEEEEDEEEQAYQREMKAREQNHAIDML